MTKTKKFSISSGFDLSNLRKRSACYKEERIPKKNGGYRKLAIPEETIKVAQDWILKYILKRCQSSNYSSAYESGCSIKANAERHLGKNLIVGIDLLNFFASIKEQQVIEVFHDMGYNIKISRLLGKCCYHPYLGLPQGACTSPYISNLVMFKFDNTVGEYCKAKGIEYTRYADDLTFSGDSYSIAGLIGFIKKNLENMDLKINYKKLKVLRPHTRQKVTGIIVNESLAAPREYRYRIKQEIYYVNKYGLKDHMDHNHIDMSKEKYLNSLLGKIGYCLYLKPNDKAMLKCRNDVLKIMKTVTE